MRKGTLLELILLFIIDILNLLWRFVSGAYFLKPIYSVTGFFTTRTFPKAKNLHRYAVLVAARNEEAVIGKLLESIKAQDYPSELVRVFVVADNCTDATAKVARSHGAICYERHDEEHRTKGFALQFLVENIRRDYGIESFEGYFLFDADNLLSPGFIANMNDSFDAGEKIVASFRNTKNFDDNWISASYALHWIRTVRNEHRARSFFRLATRIQGTGFLFASELIKDGWNYTSLTEDRAFCADAVVNGYKISYNDKAEFFDEQPVTMRIAMRQRIRWAKGHLQAFTETGPKLFSHIFLTRGMANRHRAKENEGAFKRLIYNLRLRLMSFDMLTVVFPRSLYAFFFRYAILALRIALVIGFAFSVGPELAPKALQSTLSLLQLNIAPTGIPAGILWLSAFAFFSVLSAYFSDLATGIYIFIIERRRIKKIKWYKKLWFVLTFPLFDIIGRLSMVIALFVKAEWKPIPHNVTTGIDELVEK